MENIDNLEEMVEMNGLERVGRRVEVLRKILRKGKDVICHDGEANFHEWGLAVSDIRGPSVSVAIVERDDGTVSLIDPRLIRFIDCLDNDGEVD